MRYIKECEKNLDGKMSFKPEEVADGKMSRFIASLVEMGSEIHLWTDGYAYIVEYVQDISVADGIQFVAIDTNSQWVETEADGNK